MRRLVPTLTALALLVAAPAVAQADGGGATPADGGTTAGPRADEGGASAPEPAPASTGGTSYESLPVPPEARRRAAAKRRQAARRRAAQKRTARKRAAQRRAARKRAIAKRRRAARRQRAAERRRERRRARQRGGTTPIATPAPTPDPAPAPAPDPPSSDHVFPVAGPFSFGGAGSRFGAGRPGHVHQGQDVAAAAGTPLLAPWAGTVEVVRFQRGGAGHYVVIDGDDEDRDYVFMHLRKGSITVAVGDRVAKGQRFAEVGSSGSSSGPHLHFEIWTRGGWYTGGRPVDPLPYLRAWLR